MKHDEFYEQVYASDIERGSAHGWILRKRTDVCVDTRCVCGYNEHLDGCVFTFTSVRSAMRNMHLAKSSS